ncbi:MAG: hypothetical protein GX765_05215 [Candidatus Moranbacteria bacterium]|nr:hypothetical protein [Candidatus Moranbacteria bacterium]
MNQKKSYNLVNIAEIISGYSFREAIAESKDSNVFVVQAKDTKNNLYITEKDLREIKDSSYGEKSAKDGDVIMSNKGFFSSTVIKSKAKIIPSSSVYIIRPNQEKILSEYLAIYLNSKVGQSEIKKFESGGSIKIIPLRDLGSVKVMIPEIERQKKIVELYKNIERQNKILERKKIINQNILEAIFIK